MKTLEKPLRNKAPESIFEECVDSYKDGERKRELEACLESVRADAAAYEKLAPHQLENFAYTKEFPGEHTAEHLVKVYENKLVSRKSKFRKYYDHILHGTEDELCPICGIAEAKTLDHYLPKSRVPTLAVVPSNLIPMCSDCNKAKLDTMDLTPERMPIHLYFDRIPNEPWLAVKLTLGKQLAAHYEVRCPADWDPIFSRRMEQHLDLYGLRSLFSKNASREMSMNRELWKTLLSVNQLEFILRSKRMSMEKQDMNSWQAALYRGLEDNPELLIKWLSQPV